MKTITKTILLADDDGDDVMLFKEALADIDSSIGFYSVENGEEALKLLSGVMIKKPDIIFLDINMPSMNGWECLGALKRDPFLESIPVVMYSTSSAKSDLDKSFMLGAMCFFIKPGNYKEIKDVLKILVDEHNPQALQYKLKQFKNVRFK